MNDEWKMPGTEQEENQQPVGEESEVTEATAVKEPEAGETAEAMPEATESQEPEVSERVEVTETTEEAATNGDGQVAKTEKEKPDIAKNINQKLCSETLEISDDLKEKIVLYVKKYIERVKSEDEYININIYDYMSLISCLD